MLQVKIEGIISAIVYTICLQMAPSRQQACFNDEVQFVLSQYSRLWFPYRWAISFLLLAFCYIPIFTYGKSFLALSQMNRWHYFRRLAGGPIGVARDFARFFESMSLLIYFDLRDKVELQNG